MADFSFSDVASKVQGPQQMSLGDMLNIARGAQAYQQAGQVNPLELKRLEAESRVAQETADPRIAQAKTALSQAQTQLNTEQLKNLREHQGNFSRESIKLLGKKDLTNKEVDDFLVNTIRNAGGDEKVIAQARSGIPENATSQELKAWLAKHTTNALTAEAQLGKLFPESQFVQTGATITPVIGGNPMLSMQTPGTISGTSIEAQLPPTTEIVDPITGQKKLLGTASQRVANTPLITGLGTAQQTAQSGLGETVKEDWSTTYKDAQNAPTKIGIFQNIKKLTPEAFTGPTAERRQVIASFAQVLGIPLATLESASTDELVKNTKLLQLAGGNTDAARALAEFANPNTKMTKEGINRVTDQLIGMEKMKIAKSNFVQPFAGNAEEYSKKADQFNKIADPRLFQEMKPEDVAKLRKSMSPAEQAELSKKIKLAKELGVF